MGDKSRWVDSREPEPEPEPGSGEGAPARAFFDDRSAFYRHTCRQEMVEVIFELADWIDESGDASRLEQLGVTVDAGDDDIGMLRFTKGEGVMEVRPRDDMSITVQGKIVQPDRDSPILDDAFYDEVMNQVFRWAKSGGDDHPRRCFG